MTDIEQQHAPLPAKDNQGYMDGDTAADKLNTPIILAVHLVTPSIWNSPPSIPGSNLIVGDFEAIQHVETLTPRGEEFVQELLQELKDRFNRNQKYDVPFTESELRSLVSEAIVVDAEAQTATARILAASTAVMLHAGSEQYNEPNSITPKKVFRLLAEVCRSLVQDETQPGVFTEPVARRRSAVVRPAIDRGGREAWCNHAAAPDDRDGWPQQAIRRRSRAEREYSGLRWFPPCSRSSAEIVDSC